MASYVVTLTASRRMIFLLCLYLLPMESESFQQFRLTKVPRREDYGLRFFGEDFLSYIFYSPLPEPSNRGVFLPEVDISGEFELTPSLKAYDPSYIDFPPPPHIPAIDGYKTQFVCDHDYDPVTDYTQEYLDRCFYYLYTPPESNLEDEYDDYGDQYSGFDLR